MVLVKGSYVIHGTGMLLVINVSKESNIRDGDTSVIETSHAEETVQGKKLKYISSKLGKYGSIISFTLVILLFLRFILDAFILQRDLYDIKKNYRDYV